MFGVGGFLKGAKFSPSYGQAAESQFAVEWGCLIKDPEVRVYGEKVKTEIVIKTYAKTYQPCVAWGQTLEATKMSALSEGDAVVVFGQVDHTKYTNKKGEEKDAYTMNVFKVLLPSEADVFLLRLMQSKKINQILDAEDAAQGSDAFEAEADFFEEEQPTNADENGDEFMSVPDDLETPFM